MIQEEFRTIDIPGYMVSNLGRVVSLKSARGITPFENEDGYMIVPLRDSSDGQKQCKRLVHRLVALTFIGEQPSALHEVDHIDKDKSNNILSNLRWATRKEQQRNSPSNVFVTYEGVSYILKDICNAIGPKQLYGNILSRVNRGKGTHQDVFNAAVRRTT